MEQYTASLSITTEIVRTPILYGWRTCGSRVGGAARGESVGKVVGVLLAHQRKLSGLTQARLAELAHCDVESIASVEQGRRPLSVKMAQVLEPHLDAKGAVLNAAAAVPRRERYPAFVRECMEHEEEALSLLSYENAAVPGLLQTPEYAAAVFSNFHPHAHRPDHPADGGPHRPPEAIEHSKSLLDDLPGES
ncbi:Scr1 family TA system antitoxin-like transcriptional regulator [Streptomyces sp. NPDC096136]|uniref:Scr1 family TA system antitoxin-like transcriptional regulator n=1 Tax=Streptomyces sp. NPDC096136 TaxID=3366076 RepID=UPI00382D9DF9